MSKLERFFFIPNLLKNQFGDTIIFSISESSISITYLNYIKKTSRIFSSSEQL